MANHSKRRVTEKMVKHEDMEQDASSDVDDDEDVDASNDEESSEGDEDMLNKEIQVDFEARTPEETDFQGMKRLLQQLFLKGKIDLTNLTNLIFQHSAVTSVLKQSEIPEEDSDSGEDEDDVFGLMSILNLNDKKEEPTVSELRSYILKKCSQGSDDATQKYIKAMLNADTNVGLIISERFANIPPEISVPMYENLRKEILAAKTKSNKYNFSHYVIICKEYKTQVTNGMEPSVLPNDVLFANPEEELLLEDTEMKFKFSLDDDTPGALAGQWDSEEDGCIMQPFRQVAIFNEQQFDKFIGKIKTAFPS